MGTPVGHISTTYTYDSQKEALVTWLCLHSHHLKPAKYNIRDP
jgi:hypothetical protein